jgi:hypothetical protein
MKFPKNFTQLYKEEKMDIVTGNNTGVCWGAVFAGAAVATAVSLILLLLGFGLGLSVMSPFSGDGADIATIGTGTAIWLEQQWVVLPVPPEVLSLMARIQVL